MSRWSILLVVALTGLPPATSLLAQTTPDTSDSAPGQSLPEGWEQTDQRLLFLTTQLSSVEASLDAVNKKIATAGYQKSASVDKANSARKGNELMDRKGGGPAKWDSFYGTTAHDFIAPLPPGIYAVEFHRSTEITYPSNDPVRRPKQFDYLYRANAEAERRAQQEVAALGNTIETLLDRRRTLESEQAGLWCKIAFQVLEGRDFDAKPLYRFSLKTTDKGSADAQHLAAMGAAADFLRTCNRAARQAVAWADTDPTKAMVDLQQNVSAARSDFQTKCQLLGNGAVDPELDKCRVLGKRLDDVAKNIADAYRLAAARDHDGDDAQKNLFRRTLQESLLNFTGAVIKLDDAVSSLSGLWHVDPDVTSPAPDVKLAVATAAPPATAPSEPAEPSASPRPPESNSIAPDATKDKTTAQSPSPTNDYNIVIESARWGGGNKWATVTDRVAELIARAPNIRPNADILKSDPTPGWKKKLMVIFTRDGHRYTAWADEGQMLDLLSYPKKK